MYQVKGRIFNIQRFSVHDGPGIRTVIFLKGCPLSCSWCCNPESQSKDFELGYKSSACIGCLQCRLICDQDKGLIEINQKKVFDLSACKACTTKQCLDVCRAKALQVYGKDVTVGEVYAEIRKDEKYYKNSGGGVTFSGGEPMLQADFVQDALIMCKQANYHTAIETSGHAHWGAFEKIMDYTDLFLYDIKHVDANKMECFTGVNGRLVIENFKKLSALHKNIIARTPIIPDFNDQEDDIIQICDFLTNNKIEKLHLLPYHQLGKSKYDSLGLEYVMGDIKTPTNEEMKHLKKIAEEYGLKAQIGG